MNTFSGYIELEMGGTIFPFKFGSNAWALFCEKYKLELWQIGDSGIFGKIENGKVTIPPSINKLTDLYYCAHRAAMMSKGERVLVNESSFVDYLDETKDAMTRLQEVMLTSKMLGFTFAELAEEGKKKMKTTDQHGESS